MTGFCDHIVKVKKVWDFPTYREYYQFLCIFTRKWTKDMYFYYRLDENLYQVEILFSGPHGEVMDKDDILFEKAEEAKRYCDIRNGVYVYGASATPSMINT
jgi:hypothetical protein